MVEIFQQFFGVFSQVLGFLLAHWQFVSVAAILASLGEASDRTFTSAVTEGWIPRWAWRIGRASLPSHPVLIGLSAAYMGLPPETGVQAGTFAAYAYWGFSGVLSLVFWGLIRSLGKKADLDLTLPGDEIIVPSQESKNDH